MAFITRLLLIGIITFCLYKGIRSACCPPDWKPYGGSCYYFSMTRRNGSLAEKFCKHVGGYLVEIDSSGEYNFLKGEMEKLAPSSCNCSWVYWQFYLGASDAEEEGRFIWMNSKTELQSDLVWHPGEPNDENGNEDCVVMQSEFGYKLNDFPCNLTRYSVCEK